MLSTTSLGSLLDPIENTASKPKTMTRATHRETEENIGEALIGWKLRGVIRLAEANNNLNDKPSVSSILCEPPTLLCSKFSKVP